MSVLTRAVPEQVRCLPKILWPIVKTKWLKSDWAPKRIKHPHTQAIVLAGRGLRAQLAGYARPATLLFQLAHRKAFECKFTSQQADALVEVAILQRRAALHGPARQTLEIAKEIAMVDPDRSVHVFGRIERELQALCEPAPASSHAVSKPRSSNEWAQLPLYNGTQNGWRGL